LPRYDIVGWVGQRTNRGGVISRRLPDGSETVVVMHERVVHRRGDDAQVDVASHRRTARRVADSGQWWAMDLIDGIRHDSDAPSARGAQWAEKQAALREVARRGTLPTYSTTILVDEIPTAFEVYEVEDTLWAAFGQTPNIDVTIDGRGVSVHEIALVRAPGPLPHPRWSRPPTPALTKQFPASLIGSHRDETDASSQVDLRWRSGEFGGTLNGRSVLISLPIVKWSDRASVAGTVGDESVSVEWRMVHAAATRGSRSYHAELTGQYASEPLNVQAELHFDDGHPFTHAEISGQVGERILEARIEPINGGLPRSDTFAIEGSFAGFDIGVFTSVNRVPDYAIIRGHLLNHPVHINATVKSADGRHIELLGSCESDGVILLIVIGGILQFLN
jgi:hypothetical protein